MHRARAKKPLGMMEKRIPVNPKYKNVQSKINSGTTVSKVQLISHKTYLKRRDEQFFRLSPDNLADLFSEYEGTDSSGGSTITGPEMEAKMVKNERGEYELQRTPLSSNNNNNDSGPRIVSYEAEEDVEEQFPYLILDVRSSQEFRENRIHRSINMPLSHFNRDRLCPELYSYKNKPQTLIILYEQQDSGGGGAAAVSAATSLNQKGYDNVYVLNGGLVQYAALDPDRVEGKLPELPKKKSSISKGRAGGNGPERLRVDSSHRMSSSVKSRGGRRSTTDVNSIADTMASSFSVAESVISKATARKTRRTNLH